MSSANVIDFLRNVAGRPDLLDSLKTRSKDEVLVVAAELGQPFSESEFNTLVWELEERLAGVRREPFDGTFPLWATMWGRYYLEYLVVDLLPSLRETGLVA